MTGAAEAGARARPAAGHDGSPRALVMGGSLGGLSAGVALRDAGCVVDVFERSRAPLQGRGAGIVLHPATVRSLPDRASELSARALRLRYLGARGEIAHDEECHYRFISYFTLHEELLRRFDRARYHLGREVTGFEQDAGGVDVRLAGGHLERCDLLVCADGIHSTARRALLPEVEPSYAGYVGWRGTVVESELTPATSATLADAITYCVLPGSHILVYPIPSFDGSLDAGRRLVNWVWYRNVAAGAALEALMTDREGARHPVSLGAGAVREEALAELRESARRTLPPQLAELVGESPRPFVQAVFDIDVPRMAFGRAALIGDAAFALRPHVAAGTAKAADDGWTLARAVARAPRDVGAALRRWEPERLELGAAAAERARDAGVRSQFDGSWRVGDPLPFGLRASGDSSFD